MNNEKIASVIQLIYLQMIGTLVFTIGLIIFFDKMYELGRMTDLGIFDGSCVMLSQCLQIVGMVVLTAGINKRLHPVNKLLYKKYIVINIMQLALYVGINIMIMNEHFGEIYRNAGGVVIVIIMVISASLHWSILTTYKRMPDTVFEELLEEYKTYTQKTQKKDDDMIKRMLQFVVFLILVGMFAKYILYSSITMVIFVIINLFYYHRSMTGVLTKCKILLQFLLVIMGLAVVSMLPFFRDRSPDEKGMVLILFYVPTVYWYRKNIEEQKPVIVWRR